MNKYKYLLENTVLFALSGVIVKVLSFFMLPLYTNVLSTAEYGIAELMNTTITLLTPFLSLSIAEAVIRFMLEKNANGCSILTSSVLIIVVGSLLLFPLRPLINLFSKEINQYFYYFFFMYLATAIENNLFRYAKGMEKIRACSVNAIVIVSVTICTNLILLLKFHMGLEGYLISIIAAQTVSSIYLIITCRLWRYFRINKIDKRLTLEMLAYSIPFIPTAIAWWINSAFDRYMIVFFLGVSANGLFGAASKLPAIINVITSVFTQAWQISGVKEYGDKEYEDFFSKIYDLYNVVMVMAVALMIPITPILAKFLFSGDFYQAWKFVPVLYISSIFSGLSGVLASAFYAVKKTRMLMYSTVSGAIINVLMNYVLIKLIGIQGAGIATMISFIAVWLIRYISTKKYISLNINLSKSAVMYVLLLVQTVFMLSENKVMWMMAIAVAILILVMNISFFKLLFTKLNEFIKSIRRRKDG